MKVKNRIGKQILKKIFSKWNAIKLLPIKETRKWHLKSGYPHDKYMSALRNQNGTIWSPYHQQYT